MKFNSCPYCKSKKLDFDYEPVGTTECWHCEKCKTFLSWWDYAP